MCSPVPFGLISRDQASLGRRHAVDVEGPHRDQGIEGATDPGGVVPSPVQLLHLVGVEPLGHSPTVRHPLALSCGLSLTRL
jgi:hypothetical protein